MCYFSGCDIKENCASWFSKLKFLFNYHIPQNKHGFIMDHFIKIHLLNIF